MYIEICQKNYLKLDNNYSIGVSCYLEPESGPTAQQCMKHAGDARVPNPTQNVCSTSAQ